MFKSTSAKISKLWQSYQRLREATAISKHFSTFLTPVIANADELKKEVYKIRHNVYCEELGFEPLKPDQMEMDEFDAFSQYCLIKHISSDAFAGTVRLVTPREEGQLLPLEKYCLHSISHDEFTPSHFDRSEICEISRLAVPAHFRRRAMDKFAGAATGAINESTYSEAELRCFPFIAIGLYLSAASLALTQGIQHAFVMMEPRLARSMRFLGIKYIKIGPTIEYHGQRAPYYINAEILLRDLAPSFKYMLRDIQVQVNKQIKESS